MDSAVLVLNQNYEPLNVCNIRRAVSMVYLGKAHILVNGRGWIQTPSFAFPWPSVIRLDHLVRRPRPRLKLTRREVFRRDNFTCQYCGMESKSLTIDHVVPRHRGGTHDWENIVSACPICNRRKGGRTPREARMALLRRPVRPRVSVPYLFRHHVEENTGWIEFLEGWGG